MDDMIARLVFTSRAGLQYVAEFDRCELRCTTLCKIAVRCTML